MWLEELGDEIREDRTRDAAGKYAPECMERGLVQCDKKTWLGGRRCDGESRVCVSSRGACGIAVAG